MPPAVSLLVRAAGALAFAGGALLAVPAHAADPAHGQQVYNNICASCHNPGGNPGPGPAQLGVNNPAAIAAALATVPEMTPYRTLLSNKDVEDVAAYLAVRFGAPPSAANLVATPAQVAFGSVSVGQSAPPAAIVVTNAGAAAAGGIAVASSDGVRFPLGAGTCGSTLGAGAACTLAVGYAPAAAGTDNGTVTVSYTGGAPVVVGLAGIGVAAPPPASGQLSLTSAVAFPDTAVGTASAPQTVVVSNVGGTAVTVTGITSGSGEFAVAGSTCGTVPPAGACTLAITFTPGATGTRSAVVTVASNGVGSPQTVLASGTGVSGAPPRATTAVAIEYYHAAFDHYFVTAIADEIARLDNGTFAGWARTGRQFTVYAAPAAGLSPVCRFFSTAFGAKSSHFYTASPPECTVVKSNPDWQFEAEVFFVVTPAADGTCAAGTIPVYRLYNDGQGGAPNHRLTTELEVRAQMLGRGWVPEGQGVGVALCVPQ